MEEKDERKQGEGVKRRKGVRRESGEVVEWWSGGVVEWWSGDDDDRGTSCFAVLRHFQKKGSFFAAPIHVHQGQEPPWGVHCTSMSWITKYVILAGVDVCAREQ